MRTLSLLLPILFLASCSCVARQPAPPDQPTDCKIGVLVDHGQFGFEGPDGYLWRFWFTNNSDQPDLIQEISFANGARLVECFHVAPGSYVLDHHYTKSAADAREIFIYPGEVEGVDWRDGFAHLPRNMAGTVTTSVGPKFNEDYQADHKTQGRVIKERRNQGIHWTLSISQGKMTLTIGG